MLDLLLWLVGFWVLLWALLSLLAGKAVNPLGVLLGILLAPIAFIAGAVLTALAIGALAVAAPLLLLLAAPLALLIGFLAALYTLSALAKAGVLATFLALLLALLILAALGQLTWHSPTPPSLPLHLYPHGWREAPLPRPHAPTPF